MKKYVIATGSVIAGVALATSACSVVGCQDLVFSSVVKTYEECEANGFPIIKGNPDRCIIDDNTVFVAAPKNIQVTTPEENALVDTLFVLSGKARAADNNVFYSLITQAGTVLAEGSVSTDSPEHGQFGFYKTEVTFEEVDEENLTLEVYSRLPDGTREDVITIPLRFGRAVERSLSTASGDIFSVFKTSSSSVEMSQGEFDPLATALEQDRPSSLRLTVPFTPQAPFGNWDPPFNEACEEASLIMVKHYSLEEELTLTSASNEIEEFVAWQTAQGYQIDVSSKELAVISEEYFNLDAKVYEGADVSIESIEALVNAGYPVIIPAAGQMLGNPYFLGAGPPYHMLVITGYDQNNFITNDPGTKRGEGFTYSKDTIMNAIHDWNGSIDTIEQGPKAILVIEK